MSFVLLWKLIICWIPLWGKIALKALWLKKKEQTTKPLMDEESISCFPGLIQHQNLRSLENVGFHTLEWRKSFLPNDTQYSTGLLRKHQELNCNISCFMLLPVMMKHFFPIKSERSVIHLSYLGCKRSALRCLLFTQYLIATLECIHRKARTSFYYQLGGSVFL